MAQFYVWEVTPNYRDVSSGPACGHHWRCQRYFVVRIIRASSPYWEHLLALSLFTHNADSALESFKTLMYTSGSVYKHGSPNQKSWYASVSSLTLRIFSNQTVRNKETNIPMIVYGVLNGESTSRHAFNMEKALVGTFDFSWYCVPRNFTLWVSLGLDVLRTLGLGPAPTS